MADSIIKDSGSLRQFESGAVRDSGADKGRCDLLPLDVVVDIEQCECRLKEDLEKNEYTYTDVLTRLSDAQVGVDNRKYLDGAYRSLICAFLFWCRCTKRSTFDWYLEVAHHFQAGAEKYGEDNWKKGIPINVYLDSALRHFFKYQRGDTDERHDRAFVWNILCMLWTIKRETSTGDSEKDLNAHSVRI